MEATNYTGYEYSTTFPFEKSFEPYNAKKWIEDIWHTSFYFSAVYVVVIFSIKSLMTNRKPFALNKLLLLWNSILAIFSISVFVRTLPEFIYTLNYRGIQHSVCIPSFLTDDKVSSFWTFLFILSKLPEFGDTLFIVLRKQPLIFLHWYHHILTLLYAWYAYKEFTPTARWFVVMNSFIHSFMYSYYALKAMKIRIPRTISVVITSLQICQMAIGCYVNYLVIQNFMNGTPCHISKTNVTISSLMYLSYFYLFARFFYLSYFSKPKKKSA